MNTLASLQRQLQNHILDGDISNTQLNSAIDESDSITAATRLGIYSDAYRVRLIEALQANYPVLEQFIGPDKFARLTQLYLNEHPSRHFSIRWFGHRLAEFLSEFEEYRDKPWLAELAEWEWKITLAFDAGDAALLGIDDVAVIAPDKWPSLRLYLHPSVQRTSLVTNVASIAKAASDNETLPAGLKTGDRIEWLIWRRDLDVRFRSLDDVEACALDSVARGETFEEMCAALTEVTDADSVAERAALFLRAWIDEQLLVKARDPT